MYIFLILLFLTSCSAKSPEHFLARSRAINLELIQDLQQVDDLDSLVEVLPALQRHFNDLVEVMIEAKKWQIKHKTTWRPGEEDLMISQQLALELTRVYSIPTARVLIEKSQETALLTLDAFEKRKISS